MPAVLTAEDLPTAPTVPFIQRLNQLLEDAGFESFVEELCQPFSAQRMGRPSLPPGVYFRLLLLSFLMGLDSERRIALMACDSLSLRAFLGYGLHERTPDHSTLSRTRRLLSLEVHEQVFSWVLERFREAGLAQGNRLAVDATTLQANAALKTLRHKETQQGYRAFVRSLAEAAGETVESEEDLNRFDKQRQGKRLSSAEWESPTDPDARVLSARLFGRVGGGLVQSAWTADGLSFPINPQHRRSARRGLRCPARPATCGRSSQPLSFL